LWAAANRSRSRRPVAQGISPPIDAARLQCWPGGRRSPYPSRLESRLL
jgi:hypothetical protein